MLFRSNPNAGLQQANQPVSGLGLKAPTNYSEQFQSGDIYSLANKNPNVPDYVRTAAQDQLLDELKQNRIKSDVEMKFAQAGTSKDPQAMLKLFDEFKH